MPQGKTATFRFLFSSLFGTPVTLDRHKMPDHFIEFIKNHDSPGIFDTTARAPVSASAKGRRGLDPELRRE
jgi:hypothetical protein